jgi:hypothetical protein
MQLFPFLNMVLMVENPVKSVAAMVCVPILHFFVKTFRVRGFETRPAHLVLKVKRHD